MTLKPIAAVLSDNVTRWQQSQRTADNVPGRLTTVRAQTETKAEAEAETDACPLCRGAGFLCRDVPVEHPDFGKLIPCSCRRAQQQASLTRKLSSWAPALVQLCTWDRFCLLVDPRTGQDNRQAFCAAYRYALLLPQLLEAGAQGRIAEVVMNGKAKPWLLLYGPPGTGKTHLAAAVGNHLVGQGIAAFFTVVPELLNNLRHSLFDNNDDQHGERDLLRRIAEVPVLILDDLGAERGSEWVREQLYLVVNYRYNHLLPTVITTNARFQVMDPRIASRLRDAAIGRQVRLQMPDFRATQGHDCRLLPEEERRRLMDTVVQSLSASVFAFVA